MSLVQRILFAIRTLAEDEPPPHHHSRRRHNRNGTTETTSNRRQQAVSLIMTFRDLFNSGGLNILLEDMEATRRPNKKDKQNKGFSAPNSESTPKILPASSKSLVFKGEPVVNWAHDNQMFPPSSDLSPILPWNSESNQLILEEAVPLLHEESRISSPRIISSPQAEVVESRELEIFSGRRRKKRRNITVPLETDDENKTVATLRTVLKWSPRKQSMAKFAVPLRSEEEHKVVAVVQNAVNRVKEEELQKRKRKTRLFKLSFC